MNNTVKILTALIAGTAIGVVAGVLFAPNKGSETRKKLKGKKCENVMNKLNSGKSKINDPKEGIREIATDTIEKFA